MPITITCVKKITWKRTLFTVYNFRTCYSLSALGIVLYDSCLFLIQTAQKEFSMQEDSFRKVHDLGSSLLQQADFSASQDIKQCASNLQNKWLQVLFIILSLYFPLKREKCTCFPFLLYFTPSLSMLYTDKLQSSKSLLMNKA